MSISRPLRRGRTRTIRAATAPVRPPRRARRATPATPALTSPAPATRPRTRTTRDATAPATPGTATSTRTARTTAAPAASTAVRATPTTKTRATIRAGPVQARVDSSGHGSGGDDFDDDGDSSGSGSGGDDSGGSGSSGSGGSDSTRRLTWGEDGRRRPRAAPSCAGLRSPCDRSEATDPARRDGRLDRSGPWPTRFEREGFETSIAGTAADAVDGRPAPARPGAPRS